MLIKVYESAVFGIEVTTTIVGVNVAKRMGVSFGIARVDILTIPMRSVPLLQPKYSGIKED